MIYNIIVIKQGATHRKDRETSPMIKVIEVLTEIAIAVALITDIITDIKKRVDSDQTDNPEDKKQE